MATSRKFFSPGLPEFTPLYDTGDVFSPNFLTPPRERSQFQSATRKSGFAPLNLTSLGYQSSPLALSIPPVSVSRNMSRALLFSV